MKNHLALFDAAYRSGVPLTALQCPDPQTLMLSIKEKYKNKPEIPILIWDVCRGITGLNESGAEAAAAMGGTPEETGNPQVALQLALDKMPQLSILFFMNGHLWIESKGEAERMVAIQSIWNLRDRFKSSGRMLAIICPDIKLPRELSNDFMIIDVELPDEEEMEKLVRDQFTAANVTPTQETIKKCVDAVLGLSAFVAENSVAMALRKDGIDIEALWNSKITAIEQVAGLKVQRKKTGFDQIAGLEQAKKYCRHKVNGKRKPRLVVLMDEFGDQMAGLNDSNGLNRDAQAQMLQCMQNYDWTGMICHGFAGCGKTALANAMGCEADGIFLTFDKGETKGGIVGDSERMFRSAMKILRAMGGDDVFFVGTTNSMSGISPQILRRFGVVMFFDLLTAEAQQPVWDQYLRLFKISGQSLPPCDKWTPAEIRRCCEIADEFGIPLTEAAEYISPVVQAMGDGVKAMQNDANGKYLSASTPGHYKSTNQPVTVADIRRTQKNN